MQLYVSVEQAVLLWIQIMPYPIRLSQAPRQAVKLLSAEGRAAALAAALREREACLAAAQAQLLQTEARHAQACALCFGTGFCRNACLLSMTRLNSLLWHARCSKVRSCARELAALHAHQSTT